jgi:hypothetical protein
MAAGKGAGSGYSVRRNHKCTVSFRFDTSSLWSAKALGQDVALLFGESLVEGLRKSNIKDICHIIIHRLNVKAEWRMYAISRWRSASELESWSGWWVIVSITYLSPNSGNEQNSTQYHSLIVFFFPSPLITGIMMHPRIDCTHTLNSV